MTPTASSVGTSPPRVDGRAKVTGAALYVDDLSVEGCLHGATVRSECARGTLRAIELDPAFDWRDVTVVTAEDVPGRNAIALIEDDQPALVPVGGEIRHWDEAAVLVAATTIARAREAVRRVRLVVDPLPPVLSIEESLRDEENVLKRLEIHRGGDIEAALAACDHVIESTFRLGSQEQMYIEPQGMLARFDGGTLSVTGSMQCPFYVHRALKVLVGLDDEHTVVTQAVTGGGFGGKEDYPSMIAGHAALLAKKARAPVRLIYDRGEDIGSTPKRHPALVRHRMGLTSDGRIRAVDVDVVLDGGAYLTLSPVVLSRAILHAAGPYRIDSARIVGRAVATNHPPYGAFRGFGAPQTTFAYERQVAKAARRLGIEPFELRRRNHLCLGDETVTGQRLESSVGAKEVLDAVELAASSEPAERSLPYTLDRADASRLRRGRGLAFCHHGAGFTGSGEVHLKGRATVAVAPDGAVEVRSSSTDIGQGTLTIFTQLAADALGVAEADVRLAPATTAVVPDSGPTVASRTCMVVGEVVSRAASTLRSRLESYAADASLDATDLAAVARHHAANVGELAETATYTHPPGITWDDETYTGAAYPVYGWAACLVDVLVDLDTYEVTVERCIHAVDVGKAVHPVIVEGQIEGGTLQALGWALWEEVVIEDGRVANRRMTDCIIPTSLETPELETIVVEVPYPHGPHGAKGVGEIPMDGPAAAVANAVEDALGVACDVLPLSPEAISRMVETA